MVCAFVVLMFLFPNATIPAKLFSAYEPIALRGTLVIYIPTNDGLIVAADSRTTISPTAHCDDTEKIVPRRKHPRAVIAISGHDKVFFFPEGQKLPTDVCKYVKTHSPLEDFNILARDFLDAQRGDIGEEAFRILESKILNRFKALRAHYRPLFAKASQRAALTLTLGYYNTKDRTRVLGVFHICQDVSPPYGFSTCGWEWNQIAETDVRNYFMAGRGEACIEAEVLSPTGGQLLGPQFLNDFDQFGDHVRPISQITNRQALAVAVDLIKSAEKLSDLTADSNCHVGGPIRAMLLDESHTKPFRLQ